MHPPDAKNTRDGIRQKTQPASANINTHTQCRRQQSDPTINPHLLNHRTPHRHTRRPRNNHISSKRKPKNNTKQQRNQPSISHSPTSLRPFSCPYPVCLPCRRSTKHDYHHAANNPCYQQPKPHTTRHSLRLSHATLRDNQDSARTGDTRPGYYPSSRSSTACPWFCRRLRKDS